MRPEPTLSIHKVQGLDIALWEWPGAGPPVILCHATGFHGRCWDRIAERVPGRRVLAPDFRGHGRSSKPPGDYAWRRFGEDLAELTALLALENAVGVGHSMGGHSVALAAALNPQAFGKLVLLDPVILAPDQYRGTQAPLDFVLRRRNQWASPQQMFERFVTRPPFDRWDPEVLRDYCNHALDGSQLACPPEVEASIYTQSAAAEANIYAEIERISQPVLIVRSRDPYTDGKFDGSVTFPGLAARFQPGKDLLWTHVSHFIPMEAPGETAELILRS